jgi:hypothetical protein
MKAIKLITAAKVNGSKHEPKKTLVVGEDIALEDARYLVTHGAAEETFLSSEDVKEVTKPLSENNVKELKQMCADLGFENYEKLKKDELIALIEKGAEGESIIDVDELNKDELLALAEEEGITLPDDAEIETMRKIIFDAMNKE